MSYPARAEGLVNSTIRSYPWCLLQSVYSMALVDWAQLHVVWMVAYYKMNKTHCCAGRLCSCIHLKNKQNFFFSTNQKPSSKFFGADSFSSRAIKKVTRRLEGSSPNTSGWTQMDVISYPHEHTSGWWYWEFHLIHLVS